MHMAFYLLSIRTPVVCSSEGHFLTVAGAYIIHDDSLHFLLPSVYQP